MQYRNTKAAVSLEVLQLLQVQGHGRAVYA
jgi:hypothetical protein